MYKHIYIYICNELIKELKEIYDNWLKSNFNPYLYVHGSLIRNGIILAHIHVEILAVYKWNIYIYFLIMNYFLQYFRQIIMILYIIIESRWIIL